MSSEAEVNVAPGAEEKPEVTSGNTSSSNTAQVPSSLASTKPAATSATEDEDESEDESDILEESPCGRWQKRREEVTACNPSICTTFIHLQSGLKFYFQ